mgnify:CR=1 FL=1
MRSFYAVYDGINFGDKMKEGDLVIHRDWLSDGVLVSKWKDENDLVHWEVLINGEIEMFYEEELRLVENESNRD